METYTKIKPAGLTKLNNAEYTNFMNAFQRLASLPEGGEVATPKAPTRSVWTITR
ncbi:hypothetical protein [Parabacteroides distasonis]|uniref:hypothetical protein n=1 Tax=Parabacteroides distasonis TaxID=823 RepID=UPI001E2E9ABB|nr:hypothetical protein [Parabacteroides distasonis]MDB9150968.1 hypothetical protein [Parabacteroides distasonis]MDB9155478.1 hypothetical protein [Parabacteroides distasonis]MDB9163724.1 hypothetical protein [Parabacteroides distasonis]MDB9168032.1 hypothetical protein [Parabacteroides distasonis]MDB9196796.1 hypothetical protein [Parabacteroides distasonis]